MSNIFEQSPKKEQSTPDELEAALPEELRKEFQELGYKLYELSGGKRGHKKELVDGEEEKQVQEFTEEEQDEKRRRYNELAKIAEDKLKEKQSI